MGLVAVGITVGLVRAPVLAYVAQVPQNRQTRPSVSSPLPVRAPEISVLDTEPRLARRLTLSYRQTTIREALQSLSSMVGKKLAWEGTEIGSFSVSLHYANTPAKDLLESIALLHRWEWTRQHDMLLLRPHYDSHTLDVHHPHSEAEAEQFLRGREILDQISHLPPGIQNAMSVPASPSAAPPGVPFSSLPAPMQASLQAMLSDFIANQRILRPNSNLISKMARVAPSDCTINLQHGVPQAGLLTYHVGIFDGHTGASMDFPVFADARDNYDVVPLTEMGKGLWHADDEDALRRQEAFGQDARLNQTVTLTGGMFTMPEAQQYLGRQARIDFASQAWEPHEVRRKLNFHNAPLKDVLDGLCQMYAFTAHGRAYHYTWGETKEGVFVFHISPVPVGNKQKPGSQTVRRL